MLVADLRRPLLSMQFHSPEILTNDMNGSEDDGTTGYDFEFVPSLDNKYMCPICLLALRDPVQTGCGHRFCRLCILRSIKNQARCPIDQTSLSSNQLFQDRSAQREVLDLNVRCSNPGCDFTSELRNIQQHIDSCPVGRQPCKHKCGRFFSSIDLTIHENNHCLLRPVQCAVCGHDFPHNSAKAHEDECRQLELVDCEHCKHQFKRYRLNRHISEECPQAPIQCVFDRVGCRRTHSRCDIQKHMEVSTQIHLQYLLSTVVALQKQNDMLQEKFEEAQNKLKDMEVSEAKSSDRVVISALQQDEPRFSQSSDLYFDDITNTLTNSVNLYDSDSGLRNEPSTSAGPDKEFDEIALIKAYNKRLEEGDGNGVSSSSSADSSPLVLPNGIPEVPFGASSGLKVLESKHNDHDQKIVSLDHHVRELMAKMENQLVQMKDINTKLSNVEQRMDEEELRCCNGLYYWRIKEYSKLRKAATQGDMPVLHSPGFYTSPQGYRMCVRANLDGVEKAQGTHLSLFVHIMKGEYDDLLAWPFQGTITLTVINQRELPSQRSHITETLEARTNLMAFRKPITERNQKGYGYIDFFPLSMIDSEGFIKSNTLIIKAQVKVNDAVQQ